jgi:hypothetical protein
MKVIDLLNKIANNEEIPIKIKIEGYEFRQSNGQFWCDKLESYMIDSCTSIYRLNDEIEIIEEKPKEIEFLGKQDLYIDDARGYSVNVEKIGDKVNELIRQVNYLLEKESDK